MSDSLQATYRPLLEAVSFAARAHRHQVRKDGQTPYVGHVFRVCLIVRHVFGIDSPRALMAAVLHDTIEDTTTDLDDLLESFQDVELAQYVAALSKDKRLPELVREEEYKRTLAKAPWPVKACKLADIFDNLMDSIHTQPEQRAKSLKRSGEYLEALRAGGLPEEAKRPFEIVERLLQELEGEGASR
jgi:guanosine-3',5'-bis(diphosphate) 3'-pyrophosphohydrolase